MAHHVPYQHFFRETSAPFTHLGSRDLAFSSRKTRQHATESILLLGSEFLGSLARCIKGKNGTGHALCHWTLQLITSGPMKPPLHVSTGENREGGKVKYGDAIVEVRGQSFSL
jgi:hypothetical protein